MLNTNESIIEKLNYLKLDLNDVPETLTNFKQLKFRASRTYDDSYKVYRYIDVKDIEILLVDLHKDVDLNKKYSEATPLKAYLSTEPENEEDIIKHTIFLKQCRCRLCGIRDFGRG